jgi:hypothetical protein
MILILYIIIKYQQQDGVTIIKIDNIFYKGIIDVIYILSCLFDKLHIIKPLVSNILTSDRFLVCKKFTNTNINYQNITNKLEELINNYIKKKIYQNLILESIIDNDIPYLLINKIEESNIVIAQQQLESLDQVINVIKNKNKDDKMEILKRNHIQKSIQWCEKYKIPHNKFIDKLNIFLNANNNLTFSDIIDNSDSNNSDNSNNSNNSNNNNNSNNSNKHKNKNKNNLIKNINEMQNNVDNVDNLDLLEIEFCN